MRPKPLGLRPAGRLDLRETAGLLEDTLFSLGLDTVRKSW